MKAEVLQARADGSLRHAGEAGPEELTAYKQGVLAPSVLTRVQMKAEVLQARADGELIPAGEGEFSGPERVVHMAYNAAPKSQTVALHGVR
jgi:hypothetical protein